ncbi:CBO0543 family protein [Cytobacillus solani]|uniref:Uncharacterized protein n=1 Tax=Cytobacillus solani TaxID=1637975 RepID=A0A0Q3SH46_9BACI|nr:CBO0543 family protein [Cytobacillus solani]KOP81857.1 hypothetical protein AMS60_04795 [Bacillus sp. FJAT-21945]KQL18796.1 hypothetical protein AN957_09565 [Cytobacillus solani]
MKTSEIHIDILKIYSNYNHAHHSFIETWQQMILFTPRWWLAFILSTLPWILWWKLHNPKYTGDLIRAGFFMAIITLTLDSVGLQFGLWIYPYIMFPFITGYLPWDLTLLPVSIMFMIEIMPQRSPLLKGFIYAGLAAFVGEPLAIALDLYKPIHWSSLYSFPIYILLFLLSNKVAKSKTFNSRL